LKSLCKITLRNCGITSFAEKPFCELSSLAYLDLSFNYINNLHSTIFEGLENLKVLNLSHNRFGIYFILFYFILFLQKKKKKKKNPLQFGLSISMVNKKKY